MTLCSSHLNEGDTAVDVGAHHGTYSVLMVANPSVKPPVVEICACSDGIGEAILFTRCGNSHSSLALSAVKFSTANKPEEIQVLVVTLDSYLLEHRLAPRCVKIEAEGAEIRILKGAKQVLASNADVVCELHPYAWPEFGNTFTELKILVAAAGRHIRHLDHDTEVGDKAEYGVVPLER
jgi:FkbM family methyltransferase